MLNDATGFSHIYLACGYTDLRRGIDGLVSTVKCHFNLDPNEEGSIFLFCGRRADRIKALVYEGDGFLLLYAVYFCSAEGVQTGSRPWFTKGMDFCCCISGWQMADFSGHEPGTKCNK